MPPEVASILERVKAPSDERAWAEFYELCWGIVSGWAGAMGCQQGVLEDVFQETMLTLVRTMPRFESDSSRGDFKAYLKSIVRSRIADHYRVERRSPCAAAASEPLEDTCGMEDRAVAPFRGSVDQRVESELDSLWLSPAT